MKMTENHPIQFYFLRKQPQIVVRGETQTFSPQVLKLLIYLAENGETDYDREELIRLVYGTELARDVFRKKVLYPLRKLIPEAIPESGSSGLIHFARNQIWVDSLVFAEQAQDLLYANPIFHKKDYQAATEILSLYVDPFLLEYHPKPSELADETHFQLWQSNRQRELTQLYHQLLDRVILFCLKQERYWPDAQRYAERWMRSPSASTQPLQYVIWLATRQHHDGLNFYLAELQTREEAGEFPMGPSWSMWNNLIKQGRSIPLSQLLAQTEAHDEKTLPDAVLDDQTERKELLEQILTLFTTRQVFAVVGLPGVGKTEIAHTAARLLNKRDPRFKIIMLELTAKLDLELICNRILNELGRQDLVTLDYARKHQRLKQFLQTPNLILIVDEGHTTHLAHLETLNTLLMLLNGACLMLIARELPRFDHYVLELSGLEAKRARNFLIRQVPWLREVEEARLTQIAHVTKGLPLLLHIIAGGLKKELGRIYSLLDALEGQEISAGLNHRIYSVYENTLAWLWQYLGAKDKDLLYAISLFAPDEGADTKDVYETVANVFPKESIPQTLNRLFDLHLIERKTGLHSDERWILHPIIRDFVQRRTQYPRRPHVPMIEQAYIDHLLHFIELYHDQAERLDKHQHNIFQMFDLIFFSDDHSAVLPQAVKALNQIFPYFEMRGLHTAASGLIARILELGQFDSVEANIRMLRNAAKIAFLQAADESALKSYGQALDLARATGAIQQLAGLHFDIGSAHLQKGQYEEAARNFEAAEKEANSEHQQRLLYAIWSNLGLSAFRQGNFDLARQRYQFVVDRLKRIGNGGGLPSELHSIAQHNETALGLTFTELGNYDAAMQHFQQSMVLARLLNYPQLLGYLYLNMGFTYCYRHEFDEAEDNFRQAKLVADQIQHTTLQTLVTFTQGMLASRRFMHQEALNLHRTALILAEDHDLAWVKPQILISLGKAYLRSEQFTSAHHSFEEVLTLPEITRSYISQALYGLALSDVLKMHIIGKNDVEITLELIQPTLETLPSLALSSTEILNYLQWTHTTFQRDLDHLPQLVRYRIVEALQLWLLNKDFN